MTDQHPITPPPDLLDRWNTLPCHISAKEIFVMVARWGADQGAAQELEACCEWLDKSTVGMAELLHTARRPKPPTLKEQALEDLESLIVDLANHGMGFKTTNIRRALEALPND